MPFDQFAGSALKTGKTVPLKLNMLPGSPVVHLEFLGETNTTFWNDQIARANAKDAVLAAITPGGTKVTKKLIRERRKKDRETLAKHAVRKLEAVHSDGTAATAADIPEFLDAMPDDVIDMLRAFVTDPENFRERAIESDPEDTAEKS